jgi:hypothetical protein
MKLVNQSEYGRLAGISRQAVRDAINRGAIITTKDKAGKIKIDLDKKINIEYMKNFSNGQRKRGPAKTAVKKSAEKKTVKKKPAAKKQNNSGKKKAQNKNGMPSIDLPDDFEDDESRQLEKYILQCKKLDAEIKRIDVITKEKRQELISRELVSIIFSRMHSIDTTELLQLPAKISPEITAIIGVDDPAIQIKIEKLIENELYKVLDRCKKTLTREMKKVAYITEEEIA